MERELLELSEIQGSERAIIWSPQDSHAHTCSRLQLHKGNRGLETAPSQGTLQTQMPYQYDLGHSTPQGIT